METNGEASAERPAGFWRRAAAFLADAVIVLPAGYLLETAVSKAWEVSFPDNYYWQTELMGWVLIATALLLLWLYSAVSESAPGGGTPGKRLLGIAVRGPRGGAPGFLRASARFAAKLLSAAILGFGFWMAAWSKNHLALHDRIAGTHVTRG